MIGCLSNVITMIVTAAAVLTGTASHAADATLVCPGAVQVGQQLATGITVNVGNTPLGAYSVTATYDPATLTIASVAGGDTPEFSGSPTTNPGSFTSGTPNISAFQTSSLTGPTGVVSITRVTFNAVGAGTTTVGLTVRSLFDTSSNPISATATGCMLTVTGGSTTTTRPTTTTTSSTTTTQPVASTTTSTTSTTTMFPSTTTTTIPVGACPLGQGFWKNHPSAWPVGTLMLGGQTYSERELLRVLRMPIGGSPGSDASLILAHQLIAAKLNIANGSDPTAIAATVADGDRLLAPFGGKLPYGVRPSSTLGHAMVNDAGLLDAYNSGRQTPTCVGEEDPEERARAISRPYRPHKRSYRRAPGFGGQRPIWGPWQRLRVIAPTDEQTSQTRVTESPGSEGASRDAARA